MTPIDARPDWADLDRKLVAILRGIRPEETAETVEGLLDAGFRAIEVPLNSPDPFRSIEIAVAVARSAATAPVLIGAGTVLTAEDAARVAGTGAGVVVAPNPDVAVLRAARAAGLVAKFFPASLLGPAGIKAIRAVLPEGAPLCAVGGVSDGDFDAFLRAGVEGFGLGGSLYKPGDPPADVVARGRKAVAAYDLAVEKIAQ